MGLPFDGILTRDILEPDADPITVIWYKASHAGEYTVVEDTSLDVGGADIGVNVKWLLNSVDRFAGRKAIFRVLLGVLKDQMTSVLIT